MDPTVFLLIWLVPFLLGEIALIIVYAYFDEQERSHDLDKYDFPGLACVMPLWPIGLLFGIVYALFWLVSRFGRWLAHRGTLVVLLVSLCACSATERIGKTEAGRIADLVFMPANHGSSVGFSTDGELQVGTIDVPAKYAIVFECTHGKFVIDDERAEPLWKQFKRDQLVTIRYQEVWRTEQGRRTRLLRLHFVGAVPREVGP